MSRIRQFLVATGTFSVALGIGFVMQNGDALAARFSEAPLQAKVALPESAAFGSLRPMARPVSAGQDMILASAGSAPQSAMPALDNVAGSRVVDVAVGVSPDLSALDMAVPEIATPDLTGLTTIASLPVSDEADSHIPSVAPIMLAAVTAPDMAPPSLESPVIPDPACSVSLVATPAAAAMVDLELSAACSPQARVTIHHQGMIFSVTTDDAGFARVAVPALAEGAVFIADLGNGEGAVAVTSIPDFDRFDRVALQWEGVDGPEVHALEFGATYGEPGHVWHGASPGADMAMSGQGGFLVRLGDGLGLNPMMAEVYTFPSGFSQKSGQVAFSIETPVTQGNCGTELAAQTIQVSPGADLFALDLEMSIPACEAVGEILVLKNMLLDLTLAAR
jgi:hypothetical protein